MTKRTCWVLTSEYNNHDQFGEYFVAAFQHKPGVKQLAAALKDRSAVAASRDLMAAMEFLLNLEEGGGRMPDEDVWYNLKEVEML